MSTRTTNLETRHAEHSEAEPPPPETAETTNRSTDPPPRKSALPTRKWIAGLVTGLAAFAVNLISAGEMTKEISISLVGIISSAIIAYLIPNQLTAGGYPER